MWYIACESSGAVSNCASTDDLVHPPANYPAVANLPEKFLVAYIIPSQSKSVKNLNFFLKEKAVEYKKNLTI